MVVISLFTGKTEYLSINLQVSIYLLSTDTTREAGREALHLNLLVKLSKLQHCCLSCSVYACSCSYSEQSAPAGLTEFSMCRRVTTVHTKITVYNFYNFTNQISTSYLKKISSYHMTFKNKQGFIRSYL